MEEKKEVLIGVIKIDSDNKGLSIPIKKYVEFNGVKYYQGDVIRRAFRTHLPIIEETEEGPVETGEQENPDFNSQVDDWTGVANFIETQYNF